MNIILIDFTVYVYPTVRGTRWLCIIPRLALTRMYRLNPNQLQVIVMDHIDDLRPNSGAFSGKNFLTRITLIVGMQLENRFKPIQCGLNSCAGSCFSPLNGFVFLTFMSFFKRILPHLYYFFFLTIQITLGGGYAYSALLWPQSQSIG